jgi:hypothetical protein
MSARSRVLALFLGLLVPLSSASAAAPRLDGLVTGVELASQAMVGAAVFVFEFEGLLDGKARSGWGWVAVNHEELPDVVGETALIVGGVGEIFIGTRRFDVDVNGGLLALTDPGDPDVFDDVFGLLLSVDICNRQGQCRAHTFEGALSHETFIPTIAGELSSSGP